MIEQRSFVTGLLIRRVLSGVVLILVATALAFLLVSAGGGDVARTLLGPEATAEQVARKTAELGLNQPLYEQYWAWLSHAVVGDLGRSYFLSEPVTSALASRVPVTLSVVLVSVTLTAIISVGLGTAAAVFGGTIDRIVQFISLVGHVVPSLLVAILIDVVFAVTWRLVPATGFIPFATSPLGWWSTVVLPATALTLGGVASVSQQVRGAMIDQLGRDYVRTLKSRGIPFFAIVLRHCLRNAATPALTILSLQFVGMLGGAFIIESVFALPGLGAFSTAASSTGDIPVIMGVIAFVVVVVVVVNLAVDLLNAWLNPKARLQ
jgi:peptide/nickel transport system permease protein